MKELKIKIEGMVCGGCENRVKTALSEISGVESVDANHNTGMVIIKSKEELDVEQIKERILDLGYEIVEE
ncbi:MAG: heavy-metal-associated domain-containing protein [Clostridia bacterium]